jgi:hypothetical protein
MTMSLEHPLRSLTIDSSTVLARSAPLVEFSVVCLREKAEK